MTCQAYEGEARSVWRGEMDEINAAWEKHKRGEKVLTDQELQTLAVRKFMLLEDRP